MNKKLIALAIATVVSAPAMAATSNVDVYGLFTVGVDNVTNGSGVNGNHDTTRVGRMSDYASRIGFKGAEDLGNGLSATWQIEQAFVADGGNGAAFGGGGLRTTYAGLKSNDMGEVRIGRMDTPYKLSTGRLDPFGDTLGDYNNVIGAANGVSAGKYYDQRNSNSIAYLTPNFSGFSAAAAYQFGAETATTGSASTGKQYSLAAMYSAGPMYLTAAYQRSTFGSAGTGDLAGTGTYNKAWKLGAAYSIMDFTLGALYEKSDDDMGAKGVNLLGHSAWFLSGKYQMGAIALKASYGKANSTDVADTGAKISCLLFHRVD